MRTPLLFASLLMNTSAAEASASATPATENPVCIFIIQSAAVVFHSSGPNVHRAFA